jgi:hypothetical protein
MSSPITKARPALKAQALNARHSCKGARAIDAGGPRRRRPRTGISMGSPVCARELVSLGAKAHGTRYPKASLEVITKRSSSTKSTRDASGAGPSAWVAALAHVVRAASKTRDVLRRRRWSLCGEPQTNTVSGEIAPHRTRNSNVDIAGKDAAFPEGDTGIRGAVTRSASRSARKSRHRYSDSDSTRTPAVCRWNALHSAGMGRRLGLTKHCICGRRTRVLSFRRSASALKEFEDLVL